MSRIYTSTLTKDGEHVPVEIPARIAEDVFRAPFISTAQDAIRESISWGRMATEDVMDRNGRAAERAMLSEMYAQIALAITAVEALQ